MSNGVFLRWPISVTQVARQFRFWRRMRRVQSVMSWLFWIATVAMIAIWQYQGPWQRGLVVIGTAAFLYLVIAWQIGNNEMSWRANFRLGDPANHQKDSSDVLVVSFPSLGRWAAVRVSTGSVELVPHWVYAEFAREEQLRSRTLLCLEVDDEIDHELVPNNWGSKPGAWRVDLPKVTARLGLVGSEDYLTTYLRRLIEVGTIRKGEPTLLSPLALINDCLDDLGQQYGDQVEPFTLANENGRNNFVASVQDFFELLRARNIIVEYDVRIRFEQQAPEKEMAPRLKIASKTAVLFEISARATDKPKKIAPPSLSVVPES